MASITYDYSTSTGFTFDSELIQFTATGAELKDRPVTGSELLYSSWASTLAATRSSGSGVPTAVGVSITGGYLSFEQTTTSIVDYTGNSNIPSGKTGAFRYKFIPAFSSSGLENSVPSGTVLIHEAGRSENNIGKIRHFINTGGDIVTQLWDDSGASIFAVTSSVTSWVNGTEYEVEFSFDLSNGVSGLFVDGLRLGTTITSIATRSIPADCTLRIGDTVAPSAGVKKELTMRDFEIFSASQHTDSFTSEIPRTIELLSTENPSVLVTTGQGMLALNSLTSSATATGSNAVTYSIKANGSEYYVTGGTIAVSDATYSQSSSLSDWQTRLATSSWDIDPDATVQLRTFLHSGDGVTSPQLITASVEFDFFAARDSITTTDLYGYVTENIGGKFPAKVEITNQGTNFSSNNSVFTARYLDANTAGFWVTQVPLNFNLDVKESFVDAGGFPQVRKHEINSGSQTSISLMSAAGLYTGS